MKVQGSSGTTPGAERNICAPFSAVSPPFNFPRFSSFSFHRFHLLYLSIYLSAVSIVSIYLSSLFSHCWANRLSLGLALWHRGRNGLNGKSKGTVQVCVRVCVFSCTGVCLLLQPALLGVSTGSPLDPAPPEALWTPLSFFHVMTHTRTPARAARQAASCSDKHTHAHTHKAVSWHSYLCSSSLSLLKNLLKAAAGSFVCASAHICACVCVCQRECERVSPG